MATAPTPLRKPAPEPEPECLLARVRDLALPLAQAEGHTPLLFPDLCVTRYSSATSYTKGATFGVALGVVLQRQKRVRIDRHELAVDPTRLLVVTRDVEHASRALDATPDRPYLGLSLSFSPERVARALLALAEAGGGPTTDETVPAFVMPCDEPIAAALERLLRTLTDPIERKLLAPLAIDEILFRLLRSDAAAAVRNAVGRGPDSARILESMRYIREHHNDKLTVEELARQVAMSPSHYAHRFRAVARISPMRYLREVRLERARGLLLDGSARVTSVALEVGFESPAHFTREYKRRFGIAPSKSLASMTAGS